MNLGLGNQDAVERIGVMMRQSRCGNDLRLGDGQKDDSEFLDALPIRSTDEPASGRRWTAALLANSHSVAKLT
jgi:hypothetical protein